MPIRSISLPIQGLDDHDAVAIDELYVPNLRNVRSLRSRIEQSPGGTLLCPVPNAFSGTVAAGISIGAFQNQPTAGVQVVPHNLGHTPQALIIITGGTTENVGQIHLWSYGMTDGTTTRVIATGADGWRSDALPLRTRKSYSGNMILQINGTATFGAATFSSWNSTTFSINWTAGTPPAYYIFIALGDASTSAKVVEWSATTAAGNQAVTGVGFRPQLLMHIGNGTASTGISATGQRGVGVMSILDQWCSSDYFVDGSTPPGFGGNRTGSSAYATSAGFSVMTQAGEYIRLGLASLDADGFTVTKLLPPPSSMVMATLCLAGFTNVAVGSQQQPAVVPATQQFHCGFVPSGGMLQGQMGSGTGQMFAFGQGAHTGHDAVMYHGAFDSSSQVCVGANVDNESLADLSFASLSQVLRPLETNPSDVVIGIVTGGNTTGFNVNFQTVEQADLTFFWAVRGSASIQGALGLPRNYQDLIVGGTTPFESMVMLTSKSAFTYTPVTTYTGIWTPSAEAYTAFDTQRFSIANSTDSHYGAVAAWSQGADAIRYWDGTTFGALITSGTNHAARVVLAFNNRIVSVRPYFAGVDHVTQIRWSVNGNFADWSGTGSGTLEIVESSNQPLTAGIVLAGRCYLTRAREVIELIATGSLSPVFIPEVRVSGAGCIATHSMAAGDVYAFWLGPDEVYQWDGSQLRAVGGRIYNTITQFVNYESLDQIQATVYEPDSQYWLVVPPYVFIYDYRREIWDWDDARNFAAIGRMNVQDLFTGDIDHSEFVVLGDTFLQTIREDPSINTYLGSPIDSYFETKDFVPLGRMGRAYEVAYDKYNTVWRIWFRGTPGERIEVAVSIDKGLTYPTNQMQTIVVNAAGVGITFFDIPWGVLRIRFRSQSGSVYSIQGPIQLEWTEAGVMLPP